MTNNERKARSSEPREAGGEGILRRPGTVKWMVSLGLLVLFIFLFAVIFLVRS